MRGLPGSSSGFQIGYWCRITKDDDGKTLKVQYIPDPKGEFFIVVAEIPGMGKAHENREWSAFIVRACNSHARLTAENARLRSALAGSVAVMDEYAVQCHRDGLSNAAKWADNALAAARAALDSKEAGS